MGQGELTQAARDFCRENSIYWLDASPLPAFVDPQAMPPQHEIAADRASLCPLCGAQMTLRTAKKTQRPFWRCTRFPACRGKRFAEAEAS
ncbi:topoisomerase DNA-binding C4 zinc finger domain-containing protein [Salinisphaera shabanensis]|uniref:topoisomerase DNA-binding C4 zinc finger domain-containing protein n=1 Tax=Salinisphaera shabanensis TaxID=180542 RepID=UPI0019309F6E|nr:topoisomerase DNA-binding C4 zinc finger domain-containing protein [Salinisphaera shabanensis]